MITIPEIISNIFAEKKDSTFLIESPSGTAITYGNFLQEVRKAATMLSNYGIKKGDRIAVLLTNSLEIPILYFACLLLETVAVPINQSLHPKEVRYILINSRAKVVLFSRCTRALLLAVGKIKGCSQLRIGLRKEQIFHKNEREDQGIDNWTGIEADEKLPGFEDLDQHSHFIILYTSGTTGKPKGVIHSIFNECLSALNYNKLMGFNSNARFLNNWSLAYSSGILNALLCPFMARGSTVISEPFNAKAALNFWEQIILHEINTLWLSPTMIASLNSLDRNPNGPAYASSKLTTVCCGTAPLKSSIKNTFENKYGISVYESYGLSETLFVSTHSKAFPPKKGSVGKVLEDVAITINKAFGENLEKEGEIIVCAKTTMIDYTFEENEEHNSVDRNKFPTGDMGYLDEDGYLYISGRKKDIIIRNGYNISPNAVSEAISNHPRVEEAVVVGLQHDLFGEEIAVAVQMEKGFLLSKEKTSILDLCRKNINAFSIPTRWIETEAFTRNSSGKIITQTVKELFLS